MTRLALPLALLAGIAAISAGNAQAPVRQQRATHSERTLRQTNPQGMSAAERAFANGRSVNVGSRAVPQ